MTISEENTRTLITLNKKLKADLEEIAKKENRSFNNLVVTVLKDYRDKIQDNKNKREKSE